MTYFFTNETTISDLSPAFIDEMYEKGYVFTRKDRGVMQQTRSLRIDLAKFDLSSENRRILKKTDGVTVSSTSLPYGEYSWEIGKLAKDFYSIKFGDDVMSAQKIKEMCTDGSKSNFNNLFIFSKDGATIGYTICYSDSHILHYSYPFYDLTKSPKDMGLGMMLRGILHAKENGAMHIYLGSLQRPNDTYKLQFSGAEWFDGTRWTDDVDAAKTILAKTPSA